MDGGNRESPSMAILTAAALSACLGKGKGRLEIATGEELPAPFPNYIRTNPDDNSPLDGAWVKDNPPSSIGSRRQEPSPHFCAFTAH